MLFMRLFVILSLVVAAFALPLSKDFFRDRSEHALYKSETIRAVIDKKDRYCGPLWFDEEVCRFFTDRFVQEVRLARDARMDAEAIALGIQQGPVPGY